MRDSVGRKSRVAFLVFAPLRQRREDNSFDGNDNIGAAVVVDILKRGGYECEYTSAEGAHLFDIVLVSLTSTYDVFAFYQAVALLTTWQRAKRTFKVLAGGFGMQNPTAVREFIDWSAFGRVDDWLLNIFEPLARGDDPEHESLMDMRVMGSVKIAQADQLYPHQVGDWKETFTGCPLKCKFCHYTFARKHQGGDDAYSTRTYVQTSLTGGGTPEVTWDQLLTWPKKAGRIRVAIDGSSYRLRRVYGKNITNDDLLRGIEQVGSYEGTTTLLVYNIGNFPTETDDDRAELEQVLSAAQPKYRVIVVLHTTPFRPSLATPMQWEYVDLSHDWSKKREQVVVERENLRIVHSYTLESVYSQFISVFAERATPDDDWLFHEVAFSSRFHGLNAPAKMDVLRDIYDIDKVVAQRDIDGPSPAPFLRGYMPDETLRRIAHKMRRQALGDHQVPARRVVWGPISTKELNDRYHGGKPNPVR
jgi:hypothetical protein